MESIKERSSSLDIFTAMNEAIIKGEERSKGFQLGRNFVFYMTKGAVNKLI